MSFHIYRSQLRFSSKAFHQNDIAMSNTAHITDGKPITELFQSFSSVSADNPLVTFYDIHGIKGEVLFCVGHHTKQL
jgi:hypothetical protein